jgi:hypothetical protein
MSTKILAFDPSRKVPPRRYTPNAMRGRLLHMPSRVAIGTSNSAPNEGLNWCAIAPSQGRRQG